MLSPKRGLHIINEDIATIKLNAKSTLFMDLIPLEALTDRASHKQNQPLPVQITKGKVVKNTAESQNLVLFCL